MLLVRCAFKPFRWNTPFTGGIGHNAGYINPGYAFSRFRFGATNPYWEPILTTDLSFEDSC